MAMQFAIAPNVAAPNSCGTAGSSSFERPQVERNRIRQVETKWRRSSVIMRDFVIIRVGSYSFELIDDSEDEVRPNKPRRTTVSKILIPRSLQIVPP
jgi:hypothetical protein